MLPILESCRSLVPSPTPSFSSLLSTKQRRKAGRGTGNEANHAVRVYNDKWYHFVELNSIQIIIDYNIIIYCSVQVTAKVCQILAIFCCKK